MYHLTKDTSQWDDDAALSAERRELFGAIDRFIVKVYGERCDTVQGGCQCCSVWAARDVLSATILE